MEMKAPKIQALLLNSFFAMPRAEPLVTPEELQCLLGGAPARSTKPVPSGWQSVPNRHAAAALWLVKALFLYAVITSPEAAHMASSSRYLWMRGSLELLCLAVFWGATLQTRDGTFSSTFGHTLGHTLTRGSLLVACTTWVMDAMTLLAFAG
jgi:hypothetical protein